jgi:cellulose biosynthesis protein BcsQ
MIAPDSAPLEKDVQMGKVVAVYAMKGGVGKSSLAVNLAHGFAASGKRTLIWDIDAQGAVAFLLGQTGGDAKAKKLFSRDIDPADVIVPTDWPDLDLIAADLSLRNLESDLAEESPKRLKKLLEHLTPDYDRIVLDCPPGLGAISEQIFRAADALVVPLAPAPLALRTLEQVEALLAEARGKKAPEILPVLSMVDRRKALHRTIVAAHPDWPVIPMASVVEQMGIKQTPLAEFAAKSAAGRAMKHVQARVELALGGTPWLTQATPDGWVKGE